MAANDLLVQQQQLKKQQPASDEEEIQHENKPDMSAEAKKSKRKLDDHVVTAETTSLNTSLDGESAETNSDDRKPKKCKTENHSEDENELGQQQQQVKQEEEGVENDEHPEVIKGEVVEKNEQDELDNQSNNDEEDEADANENENSNSSSNVRNQLSARRQRQRSSSTNSCSSANTAVSPALANKK